MVVPPVLCVAWPTKELIEPVRKKNKVTGSPLHTCCVTLAHHVKLKLLIQRQHSSLFIYSIPMSTTFTVIHK